MQIIYLSSLILTIIPLGLFFERLINPVDNNAPHERVSLIQHFMFSGTQGVIILSLTMITIALIGYKYGRLTTPLWVLIYWLGQASELLYWLPGGSFRFFEDTVAFATAFTILLWSIATFMYTHTYRGIKPLLREAQ
ncbi:hypothetical protein [Boudabousia marimammalium]|uniref:Uncharacterized protein n=1 Tax=Boudabousia marimammalium TaxID=156892 RepID=A0A1Q5PJ72_9ACTO|nr:hypothetical protein [Boudabousia marimammalium]OKL45913.1 hypothetical protein BM477_07865 [Boudabousia marimammalium]